MFTRPRHSRGLLLAIALTAIAGVAEAGLRPIVEVGINYSTLVYDEVFFVWDDTGWRPSLTAGVSLPLRSGKEWLSFVPGIRYVQQGNTIEFDTGPGFFRHTGKARVVQHYIGMPMMLKLGIPAARRLFVMVGPEVAYLLAASMPLDEDSADPTPWSEEILEDMERWNLSAAVGAGVGFPMGRHDGSFQVRYSEGLLGTAREEQWYSDWRTRGVEALIGIRW